MGRIRSHRELKVWTKAMDAAMAAFELTKRFPAEERYSMADQLRRCSRSVAANIAEAWRKRRYAAAWIGKLNDAEESAKMGLSPRAQGDGHIFRPKTGRKMSPSPASTGNTKKSSPYWPP